MGVGPMGKSLYGREIFDLSRLLCGLVCIASVLQRMMYIDGRVKHVR